MKQENKKLNDLKNKLKKTQENNRYAWDSYGSELCAGSMFAKEDEIKKQINKLER